MSTEDTINSEGSTYKITSRVVIKNRAIIVIKRKFNIDKKYVPNLLENKILVILVLG